MELNLIFPLNVKKSLFPNFKILHIDMTDLVSHGTGQG